MAPSFFGEANECQKPDQPGNWATLFVDPSIPWPEDEMLHAYRDHNVWMLPGTEDSYSMVTVDAASERITSEEGYGLLREFVSALVWLKGQRIGIEGNGGGTYPYRMMLPRKGEPPRSLHPLHFDHIPEPKDTKAKLGLAIYREALEMQNAAYQLLGFAKVINIFHKNSAEQKKRINANLTKIRSLSGRERLKELQVQGKNIGNYLYQSGRSAVVHAFKEPLVNPDNPEDYKRISRDVGLMRDIAEHAIEVELGVKSSGTLWREHQYELAGFRDLLGPELAEKLKHKDYVGGSRIAGGPNLSASLPRISIRLRDEGKFDVLEELTVEPMEYPIPGTLALRCHKADRIVKVFLYLNFTEERLLIDLDGGFKVFDDGTQEAAKWVAEIIRFQRLYLGNGVLEVWDVDQDRLLGRCDAFLPTNIDLTQTMKNYEKRAVRFDEIAKERAKKK